MKALPEAGISPSSSRKFWRHYAQFVGGVLFTRGLGFVREVMFVWVFGTSIWADAFNTAFRLAQLFRDFLTDAVIQTALVPVLARRYRRTGGLRRMIRWLFGLGGMVSLLVALLVAFGAWFWVVLLAPGYRENPMWMAFTARLLRLSALFVFLLGLSAVPLSLLLVRRKFFAPGVAQGLVNLAMMGVLLLLLFSPRLPEEGLELLVWAMVLGGGIQLGWILYLYAREREDLERDDPDPIKPDLRQMARLFLPVLGTVGLTRLNTVLIMAIATFIGPGVLSMITYASRLYSLPLTLIGQAIGVITLPEMASLDKAKIPRYIRETFERILVIVWPVTLGTMVFAKDIVTWVYRRGAFTDQDAIFTTLALLGYLPALTFFTFSRVLLNFYYAQGIIGVPLVYILVTAGTVAFGAIWGGIHREFWWLTTGVGVGHVFGFLILYWKSPVSRIWTRNIWPLILIPGGVAVAYVFFLEGRIPPVIGTLGMMLGWGLWLWGRKALFRQKWDREIAADRGNLH